MLHPRESCVRHFFTFTVEDVKRAIPLYRLCPPNNNISLSRCGLTLQVTCRSIPPSLSSASLLAATASPPDILLYVVSNFLLHRNSISVRLLDFCHAPPDRPLAAGEEHIVFVSVSRALLRNGLGRSVHRVSHLPPEPLLRPHVGITCCRSLLVSVMDL